LHEKPRAASVSQTELYTTRRGLRLCVRLLEIEGHALFSS